MSHACDSQERILIEFEGQLDTAKCMEIETEVRSAVDRSAAPVIFDLAKVDFVSSSFLRLCVHAYKRAGSNGFQIINVAPTVKRVFKIAGLDDMLGEQ